MNEYTGLDLSFNMPKVEYAKKKKGKQEEKKNKYNPSPSVRGEHWSRARQHKLFPFLFAKCVS
jgi:hypothetical protein